MHQAVLLCINAQQPTSPPPKFPSIPILSFHVLWGFAPQNPALHAVQASNTCEILTPVHPGHVLTPHKVWGRHVLLGSEADTVLCSVHQWRAVLILNRFRSPQGATFGPWKWNSKVPGIRSGRPAICRGGEHRHQGLLTSKVFEQKPVSKKIDIWSCLASEPSNQGTEWWFHVRHITTADAELKSQGWILTGSRCSTYKCTRTFCLPKVHKLHVSDRLGHRYKSKDGTIFNATPYPTEYTIVGDLVCVASFPIVALSFNAPRSVQKNKVSFALEKQVGGILL
jgi:hypothetical protein